MFSSSVEGLHAIVVTDRDGVPVVKGKEQFVDPFSISILGRNTVQTVPELIGLSNMISSVVYFTVT